MCDEAFRCKAITDRLLSMARPGEAGRSPVSLGRIAVDVAAAVSALPPFGGRRVAVDAGNEAPTTVWANGGELRQVVLNLVVNALEATPVDGRVAVAVRASAEGVALTVTDTGRGLAPEELARVFEPFYTAKPAGSAAGTGLGLSIAHAIVAAHGGRLTAASDGPGRGSTWTLTLPTFTPTDGPPK